MKRETPHRITTNEMAQGFYKSGPIEVNTGTKDKRNEVDLHRYGRVEQQRKYFRTNITLDVKVQLIT